MCRPPLALQLYGEDDHSKASKPAPKAAAATAALPQSTAQQHHTAAADPHAGYSQEGYQACSGLFESCAILAVYVS